MAHFPHIVKIITSKKIKKIIAVTYLNVKAFRVSTVLMQARNLLNVNIIKKILNIILINSHFTPL